MARPDETAYAVNWRTVLAADAAVGVAAFAVGLTLVLTGTVVAGASLGAFGAAYLVLVLRRWRHWRRLRAEAGL